MAEVTAPNKRAWQRMLSGRRLDLLDPDPKDVEIEDIAHGLARVARWNGQTIGDHGFSVAEHSLFVLDIMMRLEPEAPVQWQLAALLHDAPEYVIGDLISPFKAAIGIDYKKFEKKILVAIHKRFGIFEMVDERLNALIKRADEISAYFEAIHIARFTQEEAVCYFKPPEPGDQRFTDWPGSIVPLSVREAQKQFLSRFHLLDG